MADDELTQAVLRYTGTTPHRADGITATPVHGLYLVRRTAPSAVERAVEQPLVCLVLQGRKRVAVGSRTASYAAGDTMIVTANVPTASRISQASIAQPYLAIALELDPAVITDLVLGSPECGAPPSAADTGDTGDGADAADTADEDLRDAVRRLVRLLDRPESLAVLKDGLIREIHHWLLRGRQGAAGRHLGLPDSHARRIARAVALLRAEPAQPVPIERLAAAAGMSRSAFHLHFRAITSLSPLQFQKALRLMEARRLILSQGKSMSQVAFEVGYESASQFSREYARMHGRPPTKDKLAAFARLGSARPAPRSSSGVNR
ncbi:AraC family transcriptional regulator [Acidovorax sp. SUPP3334]|uniref:AraC family transcriptional regulator n=1 Tax=Acidovorax sp. SUPP3334 TaxID=2920881 RepID=UPI0023DE502B|nr:AraC family transcriptional regulator [Acidovorax sp. SUPP3334]GKT23049.1 AraC family transcriptional regulator [Acidovorax sp. SUPP3334]